MENLSPILIPKLTKEQKRKILNDCYERGFSKLKQRIIDNNVNIHFNIYSKKEVQTWERKYSFMVTNMIRMICDFCDYRENDCYHGFQTFRQTEDGTFEKKWINDSYSKYQDNPKKDFIAYDKSLYSATDGIMNRFLPMRNNKKLFGKFEQAATNDIYIPYDMNLRLNWNDHPDKDIAHYYSEKNNVVGFSQHHNSYSLALDIDKDWDDKKFYMIMKLLNSPKIAYAEKSNYSGGKHVYLVYDKNIPDDVRPKIEKYCQSNGVKVECCFYNKFIQFPCSVDYSPIDIHYYHETNEIRTFNNLSGLQLFLAYVRYIEVYYNIHNYKNNTEELFNIINGTYIDKELFTYDEEDKVIVKTTKKNFDYITKFPAYYSNKNTKQIKINFNNLDYIEAEAGNKWKALENNIKVAVLKNHITDINEIRSILKQYEGTSKTIASIPDKDIQYYVNWFLTNHSEIITIDNKRIKRHYDNLSFNSNIHLIPNDFYLRIANTLDKVGNDFYNNLIKLGFYKDKTGSKKQELILIGKMLYLEFIGKMIYQAKNPTNLILPKKLKHSFNMKLFTGFSLDNTFMKLFMEYLHLEHNYDYKKIRKAFFLTLQLQTTFTYNNMKEDLYNTDNKLDFYQRDLPLQIKFKEYNDINEFLDNMFNDHIKQFTNGNISLYDILNMARLYINKDKQYNKTEKTDQKYNLLYIYYVNSFFDNLIEYCKNQNVNAPPD